MESCPVSAEVLARLLTKATGRMVRQLEFPVRLDGGLSGAGLWLAYLRDDRFRFGVVKIPSPSKKADAGLDNAGYKLMADFWPEKCLPSEHWLFRERDLVMDMPNVPVLFMSFVDEESTLEPKSLAELLNTDMERTDNCLENLVATYARMIQRAFERHHPATGQAFARTLVYREHMQNMVHQRLLEYIVKYRWDAHRIHPSQKGFPVNLKIRVNALDALLCPDVLKTDALQLPYIPIHGDLNPENAIALVDNSCVFIDFEKARIGVPQYDLAFLFMWYLKRLILDRITEVTDDAYTRLAVLVDNLVETFTDGGRSELEKIGGEHAGIIRIARQLFLAMRTLVPGDVLPKEFQRKGARLALAMAGLARSFYEFREADRSPGVPKNRYALFGRFYFDLACCILHDAEMIHIRLVGTDFAVPLARQHEKSSTKTIEALTVRFSSGSDVHPAFFTKLVYTLPGPPSWQHLELPGWKRYEKSDGLFDYFSRLGLPANPEFREGTEQVYVWKAGSESFELPLVYVFDMNLLRGMTVLRSPKLAVGPIRLVAIDLVPLRGGSKVALGLLFEGEDCYLTDYLARVS